MAVNHGYFRRKELDNNSNQMTVGTSKSSLWLIFALALKKWQKKQLMRRFLPAGHRTHLYLLLRLIISAIIANLLLQTGADLSLPLGGGGAVTLSENSPRPHTAFWMLILGWWTPMCHCRQEDIRLIETITADGEQVHMHGTAQIEANILIKTIFQIKCYI